MTDSRRAVGRRKEFMTSSGLSVNAVYGDGEELPGEFPFTRGVYPTMYRSRLWTMRQYAGFGTASETNRRFRYLLDSGQTGLSVAFDLPTQMGYDSDHPMAAGEVGRVGVAIDSIEDMHVLFDYIDLAGVSTSMTINSTASLLLAMYVGVAEERGVHRRNVRGTVQNDMLKEFIARGTYVYPPEPSLRLVADVCEFCAAEMPRWKAISISGYHMREAGSSAVQELAFTIANGLEYVRRLVERGLDVNEVAPGLSFFFSADRVFFEEVAKFRAARRLWARLLQDRFGASDDACRLKFHVQTAGSSLTAQQPLNNVVRTAFQALSAVLGGAQSLHTNGYDEALSLPSSEAARLALRTQQVMAAETGVADTVDPLGGSHFVEHLTDELETAAVRYIARIDELGGPVNAIPFMRDEIHTSAYRTQRAIEGGDLEVVGVNMQVDDDPPGVVSGPDFASLARRQRHSLAAVKAGRSGAEVEATLSSVRQAARDGDNLLPVLVDAVKKRITLGEASDALRDVWGGHRPA